MAHSKNSATRLRAAERRLKALQLRKGGATFRQVGEALGCSESRAHAIITRELERLNAERGEAAAVVARLETERLDALHLAFWTAAVGGDVAAAGVVLKVMARRAKLLGIDAPANINVNRLGGLPPIVVEEVLSNGHTAGAAATQDPVDRGAGGLPPV
jgi:hypothetical protein